ncbi:hypothetical protein TNCV_2346401 [Trichonephila clavipes]|nr:hypothetical protein TNCV_2346401 [Trichonephila clavipes]
MKFGMSKLSHYANERTLSHGRQRGIILMHHRSSEESGLEARLKHRHPQDLCSDRPSIGACAYLSSNTILDSIPDSNNILRAE